MKVKEVMTRNVETAAMGTDLSTAAKTMWKRDCGVLPIVEKNGRVTGIVTDRDICLAAGSKDQQPSKIPVTEVMTRTVYSCSPESDIREALEIMRERQVRRLPVLDSGKLCGILSLDDVALEVNAVANPAELSAEDVEATLEAICRRRGQAA